MKDPHDLLQKKVLDVKRVRREIAALHNVICLLAEASDCAEYGLAIPPNVQETRAKTKSPTQTPVRAEVSSGLSFMTSRTLIRFRQIKQELSFFRKEGKTVLPIKVTGTRDKPSFGLDLGHESTQEEARNR